MKLDLHGKSHYEISKLVDSFIWSGMKNNKKEIEIVTGNSERMKMFVIETIEEHKLNYSVGDIVNKGYITVYL